MLAFYPISYRSISELDTNFYIPLYPLVHLRTWTQALDPVDESPVEQYHMRTQTDLISPAISKAKPLP